MKRAPTLAIAALLACTGIAIPVMGGDVLHGGVLLGLGALGAYAATRRGEGGDDGGAADGTDDVSDGGGGDGGGE